MYSEILNVLATSSIVPVFDQAAAVKYINWNGNQWVSVSANQQTVAHFRLILVQYDDDQTLKMKMDYANSICLGGSLLSTLYRRRF